jgi:hypothetical protein
MDLLTALVNRPFFLGKVPTSSDLAPATIVPEGCTVYVTDEDKVYISLNSEWELWPSDRPEDIIPYSTYYTDVAGNFFLTVTKKRADDTLYLETKLYYYPTVVIDDTADIRVTLNTLYNSLVTTELVEVDDSITSVRALAATRDTVGADTTLNILLAVIEELAATGTIGGATVNGHVDMTVAGGLGTGGNAYTYEVDDTDTAIRTLSVTFVGGALVVSLKVIEDTAATALIGGATVNGHVDMTVAGGLGATGNNLTITVDGTLTYYDLVTPASVTKVGNDILVQLKIIGNVAPYTTFFSGVANKELTFTAVNPGLYSDGSWIQLNNSTTAIRNLSVVEETPSSHGITNITIYLKVIEDAAASTVIGNPDNTNGHIDVVVNGGLGSGGNAYSFVVTIADGLDQPLSVTQVGTVLTIELGTDASGYVSLTKNTCTLVAAAINAIVAGEFTATEDGTGAEPLTYEQPSTNFSGGSNKLDDSTNTSANIETAFNAACTLVQAVADGDGSGIVTTDTGGSLANGSNQIDTTVSGDNSAGNIALLINGIPDAPIVAVADGDGTVALSAGEAQQSFAGGTNKIDDTVDGDNSAGNIADVINALDGAPITAVADGDGTVVITSGEVEANFSGGTNELSAAGNTADLIIAAIEAIMDGGEQAYTCTKRTDGTILTSISDSFGYDGMFYRKTEKYYDTDGITELVSNSYLYSYDVNEILVSEVLE